jgi:hypothetical protein
MKGQLYALAALSPGKETPVPTEQEHRGKKKKISLPGIEPRSSNRSFADSEECWNITLKRSKISSSH